jgi:UDP-N-acetylmuramyl tripeptide synthase
MQRARHIVIGALTVTLLLLTACSDDDPVASDASTTTKGSSATIHVPEDHDTIQQAVDAAAPGDLVLIAPGT